VASAGYGLQHLAGKDTDEAQCSRAVCTVIEVS
jgi:hypothetical protein